MYGLLGNPVDRNSNRKIYTTPYMVTLSARLTDGIDKFTSPAPTQLLVSFLLISISPNQQRFFVGSLMAVSSWRLKLNLGDPFDALLHSKKKRLQITLLRGH